MGSTFWLFLGIFNIVAVIMPPHTSFAFINVALAVVCLFNWQSALREEMAIREKEEEEEEDVL